MHGQMRFSDMTYEQLRVLAGRYWRSSYYEKLADQTITHNGRRAAEELSRRAQQRGQCSDLRVRKNIST